MTSDIHEKTKCWLSKKLLPCYKCGTADCMNCEDGEGRPLCERHFLQFLAERDGPQLRKLFRREHEDNGQ